MSSDVPHHALRKFAEVRDKLGAEKFAKELVERRWIAYWDVIELVVNHVSGSRGGVAGIYNKSELMPERREALERWSRHLSGLVTPVNVIDLLREGRRK